MPLEKTYIKIIKSISIIIGLSLLFLIILFIFSKNDKPCFKSQKSAILERYEPICTLSGNFMPMQTWESAKISWCVTKNGTVIPGTYKNFIHKNNKNYDYYSDPDFNECIETRNNLNIKQKLIVLLGEVFTPYVS